MVCQFLEIEHLSGRKDIVLDLRIKLTYTWQKADLIIR